MSPERIITETIRFDHRSGENARRILAQLAEHGYRITNEPRSSLHAISRTYAEPVGRTTTSDGVW